jgi:hypothetical protein
MAKAGEVLEMLCKGVEYTLIGNEFDDIDWFGKKAPITKAKFEAGFAQYDAWKAQQDEAQASAKATAQSKLEALGLTVEDLQALGL